MSGSRHPTIFDMLNSRDGSFQELLVNIFGYASYVDRAVLASVNKYSQKLLEESKHIEDHEEFYKKYFPDYFQWIKSQGPFPNYNKGINKNALPLAIDYKLEHEENRKVQDYWRDQFFKAEQRQYQSLSSEDKNLFMMVKARQFQDLKAKKKKVFKKIFIRDRTRRLLDWIYQTDNQKMLDELYKVAVKSYELSNVFTMGNDDSPVEYNPPVLQAFASLTTEKDALGRTLLYWVIAFRQKKLMDSYRFFSIDYAKHEHIVKVNNRSKQEWLLSIHIAAQCGYLAELKTLLLEADPDHSLISAQDSQGRTALHWAAENGQIETVRYLLEQSFELRRNFPGNPFLRGPIEYYRDKDGVLPVHLACKAGHLEILKEFDNISTRAVYRERGKGRATPLILAIENGHIQLVEYLLAQPKQNNKDLFEHAMDVNFRRLWKGIFKSGHAEIAKLFSQKYNNLALSLTFFHFDEFDLLKVDPVLTHHLITNTSYIDDAIFLNSERLNVLISPCAYLLPFILGMGDDRWAFLVWTFLGCMFPQAWFRGNVAYQSGSLMEKGKAALTWVPYIVAGVTKYDHLSNPSQCALLFAPLVLVAFLDFLTTLHSLGTYKDKENHLDHYRAQQLKLVYHALQIGFYLLDCFASGLTAVVSLSVTAMFVAKMTLINKARRDKWDLAGSCHNVYRFFHSKVIGNNEQRQIHPVVPGASPRNGNGVRLA